MGFLGSFGKGNDNSYSANFGESGGVNCSNQCKLKGDSCYAERLEGIYPAAKKAGIRKRKLGPVQICNGIRMELRNLRNIWLRFSVLGSLPMPAIAKKSKGFEPAFKAMLTEARAANAKIHMPVETKQKQAYYQALAAEVSDEIVVRESCQTDKRMFEAKNHRSRVVGTKGTPMADRIKECHEVAKKIRKGNESCIVCPAVKPRNYTGKPSKCGDCKACSDKNVKVVLYPLH